MIAPNPSCCSTDNPNHLCPKCQDLYKSRSTNNDEAPLTMPTINWKENSEKIDEAQTEPTANDDEEMLLPPSIDWTK